MVIAPEHLPDQLSPADHVREGRRITEEQARVTKPPGSMTAAPIRAAQQELRYADAQQRLEQEFARFRIHSVGLGDSTVELSTFEPLMKQLQAALELLSRLSGKKLSAATTSWTPLLLPKPSKKKPDAKATQEPATEAAGRLRGDMTPGGLFGGKTLVESSTCKPTRTHAQKPSTDQILQGLGCGAPTAW